MADSVSLGKTFTALAVVNYYGLLNQLALVYEGDSENLRNKPGTRKTGEEIFCSAQASCSAWSKLPPEARTASAILNALDFDFFERLYSVTIARSRKHIQNFYATKDIDPFPERCKRTARSICSRCATR